MAEFLKENISPIITLISVIIGALIGSLSSLYIHHKDYDVSATQLEITRLQTLETYIDDLSSNNVDRKTLAIIAINMLYGPETAMRMGLATGDTIAITRAIQQIGQSVASHLNKIANETSDLQTIKITKNALDQFDLAAIILKISSIKNDLSNYYEFPTPRVYLNIQTSKPIRKITVQWEDNNVKSYTPAEIEKSKNQADNLEQYALMYKYNALGIKKIFVEIELDGVVEVYKSTLNIQIIKL